MLKSMKVSSKALVAFLCALVLSISCVVAVFAEEEANAQQAKEWAWGLTERITSLNDQEIEAYENSDDSFTVSAVEAWLGSREELGAPLADNAYTMDDVTVSENAGKYTVTVPKSFEKTYANFVFLFDRKLNPTTLTVDVKLSMGTTFVRAVLNTLIGLCTVFLVLLFLSFVISMLGKVPEFVEGKKKRSAN